MESITINIKRSTLVTLAVVLGISIAASFFNMYVAVGNCLTVRQAVPVSTEQSLIFDKENSKEAVNDFGDVGPILTRQKMLNLAYFEFSAYQYNMIKNALQSGDYTITVSSTFPEHEFWYVNINNSEMTATFTYRYYAYKDGWELMQYDWPNRPVM